MARAHGNKAKIIKNILDSVYSGFFQLITGLIFHYRLVLIRYFALKMGRCLRELALNAGFLPLRQASHVIDTAGISATYPIYVLHLFYLA